MSVKRISGGGGQGAAPDASVKGLHFFGEASATNMPRTYWPRNLKEREEIAGASTGIHKLIRMLKYNLRKSDDKIITLKIHSDLDEARRLNNTLISTSTSINSRLAAAKKIYALLADCQKHAWISRCALRVRHVT